MTRPVQISLGIGLLAVILLAALAGFGRSVMPSYLAGWLFCLSLPLGALPVLMLLELFGVADWAITVPLRRFLLLQPAASLFAIPVLLRLGSLYARPGVPQPPPAGWTAPGFFGARMIVLLLIWTGLSLIFLRPPPRQPRRLLAGSGLFLHFVIGTLAASDWIMLLDPGLASSAFGLLTISLQISVALCAAILVLALGSGGRALPAVATPLLLAALGSWMFLHFIQFLIVWSADLPTEIVWYQHRTGGLGGAALWFGSAAALLTIVSLLPHRSSRAPWLLASISAMLLLVHLVEIFWLVTPGFRGRFTISLPDLAALFGLCSLSAAFLLFAWRRAPAHGAA